MFNEVANDQDFAKLTGGIDNGGDCTMLNMVLLFHKADIYISAISICSQENNSSQSRFKPIKLFGNLNTIEDLKHFRYVELITRF